MEQKNKTNVLDEIVVVCEKEERREKIDPNKWYGICYGRDLDSELGKYNE